MSLDEDALLERLRERIGDCSNEVATPEQITQAERELALTFPPLLASHHPSEGTPFTKV